MRFLTKGSFVHWPGGAEHGAVTVACFGWAGAGAGQFRQWRSWLPDEVDLMAARLPGREDRLREHSYSAMEPLVHALADDFEARTDFVFFGHCMGAVVAYELAHALRRRGERLPAALFVSSAAPGRVAADPPGTDIRAELRGVGMVPEEVLDDPVLFEMLRPAVAADFGVVAGYRHVRREALPIPVVAFRAQDDDTDMAGWAAETAAGFEAAVLPGTNLFPIGTWQGLASAVAERGMAAVP